jgi:L-fucose mutarotase
MLRRIDPILGPEALWVLAAMGHGDDLALVDRNFPAVSVAAATVSGKLVRLDGVDCGRAARAILALMPVDAFTEDAVRRMAVVDAPETVLAVHEEVARAASRAEARDVPVIGLERFAFHAAARTAFAVFQTAEARPYGCFLIRKGAIMD